MNLLNLVQNLIIVSAMCFIHSFINRLFSDRWVTRWIHDSRAANCESPVGCQLLRVLCCILGSSKPNHFGQSKQSLTSEQLYGPLNTLGAMYRVMTRTLVDAEKLLELLNEPTDINDKPGAPDLVVSDGEIEFGVCYSFFPLVINLVRYQTTSVLRTMVANLHCVVSLAASLREDL